MIDAPEVLTVDETAALMRVERKTIYSLIERGVLPGVRHLGRAIRIHRATVVEWLSSDKERAPRARR